jgi:hypothetical protein
MTQDPIDVVKSFLSAMEVLDHDRAGNFDL